MEVNQYTSQQRGRCGRGNAGLALFLNSIRDLLKRITIYIIELMLQDYCRLLIKNLKLMTSYSNLLSGYCTTLCTKRKAEDEYRKFDQYFAYGQRNVLLLYTRRYYIT